MLVQKIAALFFVGLGTLVVVPLVACGGSGPDSVNASQGAQTNQPAGSAKAVSSAGPGATVPSAASPTGGAATPSGASKDGTGNTTPSKPATPAVPGAPGAPGVPGIPGLPGLPGAGDDDDGANGANGTSGTISVGNLCCFNGQFFLCPNSNACLGGFDLDGCFQSCNPTDPACLQACASKAGASNGPVGCDANAKPPAGVDCANGSIQVQQ
jgi:hypothetical protein